ncbi:KEOPS complex subunit Pcc1 [Methanolobus sp. ZRKC2]|uniref:KEOPS complex subunit Pcc1 n=1 Tax=Methanolobus sp. ZRKC2 TaxID=3125783 RepID=UPI003252992F
MQLISQSVFETDAACSIYLSLKPEIETQVTDRSRIEFKVDGSYLYLTVEADDLVSMRSTLNTWLRLIQVAYEVAVLTDST